MAAPMARDDVERVLKIYKNCDREISLKLAEIRRIDNAYASPPREVKKDRQRIETEIAAMAKMRTAIRREIDRLTTFEKLVIIKFYIEGKSWVQISGQIHYSCTQCKNIRTKAMKTLARYFGGNPDITK